MLHNIVACIVASFILSIATYFCSTYMSIGANISEVMSAYIALCMHHDVLN